jgi:hypothetical protein
MLLLSRQVGEAGREGALDLAGLVHLQAFGGSPVQGKLSACPRPVAGQGPVGQVVHHDEPEGPCKDRSGDHTHGHHAAAEAVQFPGLEGHEAGVQALCQPILCGGRGCRCGTRLICHWTLAITVVPAQHFQCSYLQLLPCELDGCNLYNDLRQPQSGWLLCIHLLANGRTQHQQRYAQDIKHAAMQTTMSCWRWSSYTTLWRCSTNTSRTCASWTSSSTSTRCGSEGWVLNRRGLVSIHGATCPYASSTRCLTCPCAVVAAWHGGHLALLDQCPLLPLR